MSKARKTKTKDYYLDMLLQMESGDQWRAGFAAAVLASTHSHPQRLAPHTALRLFQLQEYFASGWRMEKLAQTDANPL